MTSTRDSIRMDTGRQAERNAACARVNRSKNGSGANGRIWPAMMSAELPEGGHGKLMGVEQLFEAVTLTARSSSCAWRWYFASS